MLCAGHIDHGRSAPAPEAVQGTGASNPNPARTASAQLLGAARQNSSSTQRMSVPLQAASFDPGMLAHSQVQQVGAEFVNPAALAPSFSGPGETRTFGQ